MGGLSGMMGHGMMGPGMMRMIFSLMDTDSDGAVSLAEFQAAHERMFKSMDTNKDDRLTFEEMQAAMRGRAEPAAQDRPPASKPQQ
jgi:hypothetical protein